MLIVKIATLKSLLNITSHRFDQQMAAVKDKLENARAGASRGITSPATINAGFNLSGRMARVARPLRGGGGGSGADMNELQLPAGRRSEPTREPDELVFASWMVAECVMSFQALSQLEMIASQAKR